MHRRDFLKRMAAAVPAASFLSAYRGLATQVRRKVKITDVKVMVIRSTVDWNMVKIETDSGMTGIGEAYWGWGVKDVILSRLRQLVVGEDPLDIEPLSTKMARMTGGAGSEAGVTVTAISGVEIALWDLAGKILNAPVCKLLGGPYREEVRAYWTNTPKDMLDPGSCREFAALIKSHPFGITAIKADVDPFPGEYDPSFQEPGHERNSSHLTNKDLSRISKAFSNLREAVGDDIDIAVHCHWEFDWIDALGLARAVAPIQPMWLEDVMPPYYSESWSKLTQESPVPILTGENLYRRQGFEPFILNQGCHMVQIDIPKAGGLLESKKIADLAELFYLPVCAHNVASPLGSLASAHCAAAIRDFRAQEFAPGHLPTDQWAESAIYDGPIIKNGKYRLSDKPGFGVDLNEDFMRAHLVPGETWWGG